MIKHLLYLVLITLTIAQPSCIITLLNGCMDNVIQEKYGCDRLEGNFSETESCSELGYDVGFCCTGDYCVNCTGNLCATISELIPGANSDLFTFDSERCPCDETQSCCFGNSCEDGMDRDDCVDQGGVHFDVGCGAAKCLLQGPIGGCCQTGFRNTCYNVPEIMCKNDTVHRWSEELCNVSGCDALPMEGSLEPILSTLSNSSNSSLGRCCYDRACDDEESSGDCLTDFYYEESFQCYGDYSCYPTGACWFNGICADIQIVEDLCFGSFVLGGNCPEMGACYADDIHCNTLPRTFCQDVLNLTFFLDEDCPEPAIPGACCSVDFETGDGSCRYASSNSCPLGLIYTRDKTCEEIQCGGYKCCSDIVCRDEGLYRSKGYCNLVGGDYLLGECSESGTCDIGGDQILVNNRTVVIGINASYVTIILDIQDADISIPSATIFNSSISLTGSNFTLSALSLRDTFLNISLTSSLSISGCLDLENASISVSYSEQDAKENEEGEIELITFGSLCGGTIPENETFCENNISRTIRYSATNMVILFSQETCTESGTDGPEQFPIIGIVIIILIITTLIIIALIIALVPSVRDTVLPFTKEARKNKAKK